MAAPARPSTDRLRPVLRRHRRRAYSAAPPREADEVWPEDEMPHAYAVGAPAGPLVPVAGLAEGKFARVRSQQRLSAEQRARRVVSHRVENRASSVFARRADRAVRRAEARRSITEVEKVDVFGEGGEALENSCYSIAATVVEERGRMGGKPGLVRKDDVVQGYCRMAWFAGLRCTRFLRLVRGQLHCFDSGIRRKLWAVVVDGARVRVQPGQNKIVLSKLQCGYLIEFFLYDPQSCRDWGAALLRASMPGAIEREAEL